jgi:CheY-like chemotaxis protein
VALSNEPIAMLVTDLVLPGIDGCRLALELRERMPGLPVLFLSGYAEEPPAAGEPGLEGSILLSKPYTLERLRREVRAGLARR